MSRSQTFPLGWSMEPGDVPTLAEFLAIKRERCRRKLAAEHVKALAAAVFAAFGDASRPVLASQGITIEGGMVRCEAEDRVDDQWKAIVAEMYLVHREVLRLPCDTRVDPATGFVSVVPSSHDAREGS